MRRLASDPVAHSPARGWAAVLFDLDGTLADTVPLILRCYRHTMLEHLGEERPDGEWLAGLGRPLRDQLLGFARDPAEAEAMLETYTSFQRTVHDDMVRAFSGAREVVVTLRKLGTRVAVVTSKRREIALRTLECCGLAAGPDVLVAVDDVTRGKPDPEPVWTALERMGLEAGADDVVFVGDSPFDIRAGKAAGVRTAGVLWGPFGEDILAAEGPDWLLDELPEVLALH